MKLIFIHGAPAVGKLTIARELAGLTGLRLFHNHLTVDLVSAVFDFGTEPFVILREQIWLSVFREAAKHNISLIFTFNPENTVRERFIQDVIDDVSHVRAQIHERAGKMDSLSDSRQARSCDLVPVGTEKPSNVAKAMSATPGAVDKDEDGHRSPRCGLRSA